ncbi:MAG TPA: thiamine biosynthesis protein ThiS [Bacteroidales bacterium]|nr:thiamine biosynthesis protein ThiS [Bacteroidales bacterium]
MKLILNNREEEFSQAKCTVSQLLEIKKLSFRMRIIKINGVLIPKDEYETTCIKEGDNVQVIYLMSGG